MDAITALVRDMTEFLKDSELHERRAFTETFVKEIVVMSGKALIRYNVPMAKDSDTAGADSEEVFLDGSTMSGTDCL